jgi:NADH dehydrogenase
VQTNASTPRGRKTLVVGATGLLGLEVVRQLRSAGTPVRAVVQTTADREKRERLEALGAELVAADLKNPASLREACRGVEAVVSTASATQSRVDGDSIETVDGRGQLALVEAAEREHVQHFVFVSFPPLAADFALQRAKRAVEARLRQGALSFTILQPVYFPEVWLSAALGFDPAHGHARVFGTGDKATSWISFRDVARFTAAASEGDRFAGNVLPLGGPDALSPLQVVRIFEELGAPRVTVEHVPESALLEQLARAKTSLEEAFAALMLGTARGLLVDQRPAQELLPAPLGTIRDYATSMLAT